MLDGGTFLVANTTDLLNAIAAIDVSGTASTPQDRLHHHSCTKHHADAAALGD